MSGMRPTTPRKRQATEASAPCEPCAGTGITRKRQAAPLCCDWCDAAPHASRCVLCGLSAHITSEPYEAARALVIDGDQVWHRGCWLLRNSRVGWLIARGVR